jgi:phosphatidylserine/phosphatidylglycerophosphate/cardiolipin synthase-like enzyme
MGALGNQSSGRMFYTGSNKEDYVTLVQMMLIDLGYDVGSVGADGIFGNNTEKAVKEFQEAHEDWGGEKLNVDGLVGPETADALNHAMVGIEGWYDKHQTEKDLTVDFALLSVKAEALQQPVSLDVDGLKEGKIILKGNIPRPEQQSWFNTEPPMQPVRSNNRVTELIDGDATFHSMVAAINSTTSNEHYIYLLNWIINLDFNLPGSSPASGLFTLLNNAVTRGVQVRAMFWDQAGTVNSPEFARINLIPNTTAAGSSTITGSAAAILDNNTLNLGSHHQKILAVKGSEGLITFCGGVDFNPDRIDPPVASQQGSPMHDVHCRITGPAAWDLLQIFIQRWTDHPQSRATDHAKGALRGVNEPLPSGTGSSRVQIGRTYGNGSAHGGITNARGQRYYSFAQNGEQTAWQLTLRAIQQAQQYIYMENQYIVSMAASNALRDKLAENDRLLLIILIPYSGISDLPQVWRRTRDFINNLGHASQVSVCYRLRPGQGFNANHNYIHAKMFIIDDEFSIIGSANCNRRGYTHDSEVVAGIHDTTFARDLRVHLWQEHLGMPGPSLSNAIASAAHWFSPPRGSFIARYDPNAAQDTGARGFLSWDGQIDPDGS